MPNVCRVLCSGCPEQPQELQEHFTNAHVSRRRRFLVKFASVRARGCRAAELLSCLPSLQNFSELNRLKQSLPTEGFNCVMTVAAATFDWFLCFASVLQALAHLE